MPLLVAAVSGDGQGATARLLRSRRDRAGGIAQRLSVIRGRVADACRASGRRPEEVWVVGAVKTVTPERVAAAVAAGLTHVAENRVQEAARKARELPATIDWHLIGPLQSNKARRAVELFSTIHSIDRPKIARAIDRLAGDG